MSDCLDALVRSACSAIAFRTRTEILRETLPPEDKAAYASAIAGGVTLRKVLGWQNSDGYFGDRFHTPLSNSKVWPHEGCVRYLLEMGLTTDFEPLRYSLDALLTPHWAKELERSKAAEVFGAGQIRASLFAQAGLTGYSFVCEGAEAALDGFRFVAQADGFEDIALQYRDKFIFAQGKYLPNVSHMRILAFTQHWRTDDNLQMLRKAFRNLYNWLPLSPAYIKAGSQLIAPAQSIALPFNTDPDPKYSYPWFQFYEMSGRMGMMDTDSPFRAHFDRLMAKVDANGGWFTDSYVKTGYMAWSGYSGMALEDDWRIGQRKMNDFTFRCHLIRAYASMA